MYLLLQFFCFLSLIFAIHSASYPTHWEKCKVSPSTDNKRNKCIEGVMDKIIQDLYVKGGNEDLFLGTIDPFKINTMVIGQSEQNRPVRVSMHFKNLDIIGFKDLRVKHVSGNLSSPKDFFLRFEIKIPHVEMLSDYKVDGSILILPITGNGKCKITYTNVTSISEIFAQPRIKDEKEYLNIGNATLSFDVKGMTMNMENLFNGNKVLGDTMNRVINENWNIIYQELKPSMEQQLNKNFAKYTKKILEKIPYKDLFLAD